MFVLSPTTQSGSKAGLNVQYGRIVRDANPNNHFVPNELW